MEERAEQCAGVVDRNIEIRAVRQAPHKTRQRSADSENQHPAAQQKQLNAARRAVVAHRNKGHGKTDYGDEQRVPNEISQVASIEYGRAYEEYSAAMTATRAGTGREPRSRRFLWAWEFSLTGA